jgi:putative transposase
MPWHTTDTMNQRTQFALQAISTANFSALCRQFGISTKTGYKWKQRFLAEGRSGLLDGSRRPHSSPEALDEETIFRIVRLRQQHRFWGPRKLREVYDRSWGAAPSESSFKRVLNRCALSEPRRPRIHHEKGGRICSGRRAAACNEVWSVDFKGWWHDGAGRSNPFTIRDEFSRYVLCVRHLPDGKSSSVKAVFEELFKKHGLPQAIRSDNGAPFACTHSLLGLTRLSVWWLSLGIELERSRPGCPQDNGAHERMHKDIAREIEALASSRAMADAGQRQALFDVWREEFNQVRPHEALGMKRPADVYSRSPKAYPGQAPEQDYKGMETRRVTIGGRIKYGSVYYRISTALSGMQLGLKAVGTDRLEVYYARLLLGHMEMSTESFQPVEKGPRGGAPGDAPPLVGAEPPPGSAKPRQASAQPQPAVPSQAA